MVSWTSVWSVWGSAAFPFCIIVIICCKKSLLVCSMWWGSAVLLGTCVIWYYAMSCSIFICINWPNQYPDTNCEYKTICLSTVPLAMRKERHKNVQFIPGMFNVCWFFFFFWLSFLFIVFNKYVFSFRRPEYYCIVSNYALSPSHRDESHSLELFNNSPQE